MFADPINMRTFNIDESERIILNHQRFYYPCPIVQKRISAVYLKYILHLSDTKIGVIVDLHRNMVSHWSKIYQLEGYDALCKVGYGTNNSKMAEYSESIEASLVKTPPKKITEAIFRIEQLTGIKRGITQVKKFVKQLGFSFRKMGHIPAKANTEKQHKWVEEQLEPIIEKAKNKVCHLLFSDASHFVLQPFVTSVWSKVRLFVKASAGRNRINVLGAVNAINKEVTTLINDTYINAETLSIFLHQLKEQYVDLPIYIVLDNARYQSRPLVGTIL